MYKWKIVGYNRNPGSQLYTLRMGDAEFVEKVTCIENGLKALDSMPVSFLLDKILVVEETTPQVPITIKYPSFWKLEERLNTFKNWPRYLYPRPEGLAKAGFFYTQISDKVTCFWCGKTLSQWAPYDDPVTEHGTWSSECPLLKMCYGPEEIIQPKQGFEFPNKFGCRPAGTG